MASRKTKVRTRSMSLYFPFPTHYFLGCVFSGGGGVRGGGGPKLGGVANVSGELLLGWQLGWSFLRSTGSTALRPPAMLRI